MCTGAPESRRWCIKIYMEIQLKCCEVRVFWGFSQVEQIQANSMTGKLSFFNFYQPGIWLIVFSGEMRESETNLLGIIIQKEE